MARAVLPLQIRKARPTDRDAVTALLAAQFREHHIAMRAPQIARAVEGVLSRPRHGQLLVATLVGKVVGVAALSFIWPLEHGGRSAWLEELYVEPEHRDGGIGRRLLTAACAFAAESGAVAVDLEVDAGHRAATRLYAREGFQPLDRQRWVRRLKRRR